MEERETMRGLAIGFLVAIGLLIVGATLAWSQPYANAKLSDTQLSDFDMAYLKQMNVRDTTYASQISQDSLDIIWNQPLRGYPTLLIGASKAIGADTVKIEYRPLFMPKLWKTVGDSAGTAKTIQDTIKPFNNRLVPILMTKQAIGDGISPDSGGFGFSWSGVALSATNTMADSIGWMSRSTPYTVERNIVRYSLIPTGYCDGIRLYFTVQDTTRWYIRMKAQ